jgi:hypothetical protein
MMDLDIDENYRVIINYSGGIKNKIADEKTCQWAEENEETKIIDKIVDSIKIK